MSTPSSTPTSTPPADPSRRRRTRSSWVPPRLVRRLFVAPLVPLIAVVLATLLPLQALALAFATRYVHHGPLRGLRLLWVLVVWLLREAAGIVLLFGLWVGSGFGWKIRSTPFQRQHVRLMGWYLWGLVGSAQRTLGLRLVTEESPGVLVVEPHIAPRPVLVFSRHAGAGDSFLLAHELINTYGRTPRIVLKDTLEWAPCVDIALNRLPSRFISPNPPPGEGVVDSIGELAAGLPPNGALILFPEGGNFSERRRLRAIAKLESLGLHEEVAKARELTTVLPPRPGGVLAALSAAPQADVIFVAHTGLERLSSFRQVLDNIPLRHSIRMAWWRVPAEEVPADERERISWLYAWWEEIDTWIERHTEPGLDPAAALREQCGEGEAPDEGDDAEDPAASHYIA